MKKGDYELPNDLYIVNFYRVLMPPVYSLTKLNSCKKQLVLLTCIIIEAQGSEILCFLVYKTEHGYQRYKLLIRSCQILSVVVWKDYLQL